MSTNQDDIDQLLSRIKVISNEEAEIRRSPAFEDASGAHFRKLLHDAGLPARHAEDETQIDMAGQWGETYRGLSRSLGKGFLCALIGPRGVGKTQLATQLAKEVIKARKSALFATATRFLMDIKETYRKDAPKTERQVISDYAKPKLLILDEIGRRGETDWEDRLIFELLNDRYNAMNDTVLISNHPTISDLSKSVGDSLVSRIIETGGVITCNWKSFRA